MFINNQYNYDKIKSNHNYMINIILPLLLIIVIIYSLLNIKKMNISESFTDIKKKDFFFKGFGDLNKLEKYHKKKEKQTNNIYEKMDNKLKKLNDMVEVYDKMM